MSYSKDSGVMDNMETVTDVGLVVRANPTANNIRIPSGPHKRMAPQAKFASHYISNIYKMSFSCRL